MGELPEPPELSAVVPVFNEVDSLPRMYDELVAGLSATGRPFEIVFVDDGSTDGSAAILDELAARDDAVRVIHFRKNFGKSPALAAAFERVRGQIVITLDADLQDDPAMIGDFVARIDAGADLVSGYKQQRHDPLDKTLPSRLFNLMTRIISGVPLRDFNCGYKAYRIECIRELNVYGGFHRFLPVLAEVRGFRIEEIVVAHRARQHGVSKFGAGRLFTGLVDMLTVLMLTRFRTRPAHLFGFIGVWAGLIGGSLLVYLSILWLMGEPIGTRPLLTLGVLLTIGAIQFLGLGLVSELLVRTTIRSKEIFSIKSTAGFSEPPALLPPTAVPALPRAPDDRSESA